MKQEDLKERKKLVEIDKSLNQFTGQVAGKEKIERAKEKVSKLQLFLSKEKNKL